jgi:diguanylate cyclase (GGDEF)-like protein
MPSPRVLVSLAAVPAVALLLASARPGLAAVTPGPDQTSLTLSGSVAGPLVVRDGGVECDAAQSPTKGAIRVAGKVGDTGFLLTITPPTTDNQVTLVAQGGSGFPLTGPNSSSNEFDVGRGARLHNVDVQDPSSGADVHIDGRIVCNAAPLPTPGTAPASATPGPSQQTGSSSSALPLPLLGGIAAAVVLLLLAGVLVLRRRRGRAAAPPAGAPVTPRPATPTPPASETVPEAIRRLQTAYPASEMTRGIVREAMTVVPALAAGLVRAGDGDFQLRHESHTGMFDSDHLGEGLLDRAASTGQPVMEPSTTDPAIRPRPVAVLAVPLVAGDLVRGLLVMVRMANSPFTDADRDALMELAPAAATALAAAPEAPAAPTPGTAFPAPQPRPAPGPGGGASPNPRAQLEAEGPALISAAAPDPSTLLILQVDQSASTRAGLGHRAAEELLRATADILRISVRPSDRVYRLGDDLFAALLPGAKPAVAAEICLRLLKAINAAPLTTGGRGGVPTLSIGVAVSARPDVALMVQRGTAARLRASQQGGNRAVLDTAPGQPEVPPILGPAPSAPAAQ